MVLLAAGVGVTLMVSALNHARTVNPQLPLHLLYAMRNADQFMHKEDIAEAQTVMPNLDFKACQEDVNGRMSLKALSDNDLQQGEFYLCGPLAFMQDQRKALLELGVTANRIHREVFGPDLLDHLL